MRIILLSILTVLALSCAGQNPSIKIKGWMRNSPHAINLLPVANAGVDKVITLPTDAVTLFGSGYDQDGSITAYLWSQVSGPSTASLTGSTTSTMLAGALVTGVYQFKLRVTDNKSDTAVDYVTVTVNKALNIAPGVSAGANQTLTLPLDSTILTATGTDTDGTVDAYAWVQLSGPNTSAIESPASDVTEISGLIEGIYEFEVTATDNNGGVATDRVKVTVIAAAVNILPIANAGINQTITLPDNSVNLVSLSTDADGTILTYLWESATGTVTDPTNDSTSVVNLTEGEHVITLTVTDDDGGVSNDEVTITVLAAINLPPNVTAGSNITMVAPLDSATLFADAEDPDGEIVTYLWTKVSGPTGGTISNGDSALTVVTDLVVGVYRFQVLVTDNGGATQFSYVDVEVIAAPPANQSPTAEAGANHKIVEPVTSVTLEGSGSDEDGLIATYSWIQISGPNTSVIESASLASTLVNNLIPGTYVFELTVTDDDGATGTDLVTVTVLPAPNILPQANAGPDKDLTLPSNTTTFNGLVMDIDGTVASITWTKISGPSGGAITSPSAAVTGITGLLEGTYEYELTVTDNDGGTGSDRVKITVRPAVPVNKAPTASAGANIVITSPTSTTTLTGSGTDTDGTISTYGWVKLSGPTGGAITSPSSASTGITGLVLGVYEYELTVTDDDGAIGKDRVIITVNGPANALPTVAAGSDQTITLPTNSVTVTATAADSDGTIASIVWSWVSGPGTYTIVSPTSASTLINNLIAGVYKFQVRVVDNSGAVATDDIQITVNSAGGINNGNFTFVQATAGRVSISIAGFDSAIVKHIASDTFLTAGTHTINWNGRDDFGVPLAFPASQYVAKILANNLVFTWQGTIGNNSTNSTGELKHRGYYRHMSSLCFSPLYGYYCTGYSEGSPSVAKFSVTNPGVKIALFGPLVNTGDVNFNCTDGNIVYWGAFDPNVANMSFVFGTNVSNDAEYQFATGSSFTIRNGKTFLKAINITNLSNSLISGMAVQRTGNYLFVARAGANMLQVIHKTTGAVVQTITLSNVRGLSTDASNNLWAITGTNTVSKYTVNLDGTISSPTLSVTAVEPHSTSVNPAGTVVSVTEGGVLQQVKHFNNSTGAAVSTLGTAGGYYTSASVTNYKFYFTDVAGLGTGEFKRFPFVAYQSDGSFWVNDAGNFRSQHYNSSNVFIDNLMFLGVTYSTAIDNGNINRVFCRFLEFNVNYITGAWSLTKNWGARISPALFNVKYDVKFNTDPRNGRTYGLIANGPGITQILELSNTGDTTRPTGIFKTTNHILQPNGDLFLFTRGNIGGVSTMVRFAATPFSGINPTWSSTSSLVYRTPTLTFNDPNAGPRSGSTIITSTGKVIVYVPSAAYTQVGNRITLAKTGWHLGAIQEGTQKWLWVNQLGTHINYMGAFPNSGAFDVGNIGNDFAGGGQSIVGRYVLTSHHGEFWKNLQTNYFNLFMDNGLALGQFGTDRHIVGRGNHAVEWMAGNALTPQMVREPTTGNLHLIYGDESDHSGMGLAKISNLQSITQQDIVFNYPTAPKADVPNIMTGLPWDAVLPTTAGNWTRSHPQDSSNVYSSYYLASTSVLKYKELEPADIFIKSVSRAAATKTVEATLGTNNVTIGWRITGKLAYPNSMPNGLTQHQYVDVLDNAGKILIRFYPVINRSVVPAQVSVMGNTLPLFSGTEGTVRKAIDGQLPFEFKIVGGVVTINYGGYTKTTTIFDPTADWHKPTKFRISHISTATATGAVYTQTVGVADVTYFNLDIL